MIPHLWSRPSLQGVASAEWIGSWWSMYHPDVLPVYILKEKYLGWRNLLSCLLCQAEQLLSCIVDVIKVAHLVTPYDSEVLL